MTYKCINCGEILVDKCLCDECLEDYLKTKIEVDKE